MIRKKILLSLASLVLFAVAGGAVFLLLAFLYLSNNLPSVEQIASRQIDQSTKIYDREGNTLLYEVSGGEKRTVIPLEEIPQFVKDATIAIEDENFYEEAGVNWRAILRAFLTNLIHGRIVQGGSTITQQLAKNAFLSPERTVTRKIREWILASQLSRNYSKDEILGFYLNEIPYGPTAYGIESASKTFFGKSASELNLAEAALLAALPRAPSYYSPHGNHRDELLNRQKFTLRKMRETGKIDPQQLEEALGTALTFQPPGQAIIAPHFTLSVQDYLVSRYGEDLVRTGGLKVKTTLNLELQALAERAVREGAEKNQELYQGYNAALVAQDPKTGQILALVGSRDYFASSSLPEGCIPGNNCKFEPNFSVATQGFRQPGSALKPFAYLTAFQKGYTPDTVVFDVPTEFVANNPQCPAAPNYLEEETTPCFHPENFDERFRGPVSFRRGLAQSINVPSVKALYLAGLVDTLGTLKNFGITSLVDPSRYGLSLVLGGGEVKLIELVGAYAALAQEGARHAQATILEVKDSAGRILESYHDSESVAADAGDVRLVNDILTDLDERSGLFQGSLALTVFPDREVALKTGTSNDYRDAWALGYTPSLAVGVWAGNNDNAPMQRRGSSILAAIPIWSAFMKEALPKFPADTFLRPSPATAQKPVLRGEYLSGGEAHSILFHVDRRNPEGPPPQNPAEDPQFSNWEEGVRRWVSENPGAGGETMRGTPGAPQIDLHEPKPGISLGNNPVQVRATMRASAPLSRIRVLFNGEPLQEFRGPYAANHEFVWIFSPRSTLLQNELVIEATDDRNRTGSARSILFK